MCFSPFAKQNQAEVWSQFQCLLKFLLWTKGDEWVKVLNALDPLCLWQCLEYTTHPKCGLRCGRVWWICGRVGNAKARGKMREIGALCFSDSVQSGACDIWTHYATQNRCTVLLIFGVVCGLHWQCGWTHCTTQNQCTMPQPPCILCSLFCPVYWWCINHSEFVQPLVQEANPPLAQWNQI